MIDLQKTLNENEKLKNQLKNEKETLCFEKEKSEQFLKQELSNLIQQMAKMKNVLISAFSIK